MLEEHTVPFLQRWHIGFGFMGEQDADESIHNSINQLEKHYMNMPNRVKRLEVIVRQHHLAVYSPLVVKNRLLKNIKLWNSSRYIVSYFSTLVR